MKNEEKRFEHEKLDVYRILCGFLGAVTDLVTALPRGEAELSRQLRRAADSTMLNLCEGAGRFAPREKAHYYDIARGSITECAGALDVMELRRLLPADVVAPARELARRIACMLTRLAKSWRMRERGRR